MSNLLAKLESRLMPIAQFFGSQRHFIAVRDGIVSAIPFTIIGSLFLIIAAPPFTADISTGIVFLDSFLLAWLHFAEANAEYIMAPYHASMGIMSLFICIASAYSLTKSYKKQPLSYVLSTVCIYIMVITPIKDGSILTSAMESQGILLSVFVALISVEIMRFVDDKGWTIRMPKGVPPVVSDSFSSLFPFGIAVIILFGLSLVCQVATGKLIPDIFFSMFANVKASVDNVYMITLLIGLESFLFGFGVHPTTIVGAIINPISLMNTTANAEMIAKGMEATNIYTDPFFSFYIGIGGAGATLILCFMLLKSKSKQMKELGKIAVIPSIFNINEPLIFGLPIFLNPIMIIPFTIVPMVNTIIGWVVTAIGLVAPAYINAPWTAPAPFATILSTMDWKAGILVICLMAIDGLIWYPFMKIYERQLLSKEEEEPNG